MTKPIDRIAELRQIDLFAARAFCTSVQRCFTGAVPPYKLIAEKLSEAPTSSPQQIAEIISPNFRYQASVASNRIHNSNKKEKSFALYLDSNSHHISLSAPSFGQKNPILSKTRLEPSKARTCPHGIPFYRKCGICNKEEFQELTGLG